MADVDEVEISLGAEINPRVWLKGTGSKGREAGNCLVEQQKGKTMREQLAISVWPSALMKDTKARFVASEGFGRRQTSKGVVS